MKRLIVQIENEDEVLMSLDKEISFVSFGALDRGNVSDITNWGCFSNTGDVEFIDSSNEFGDFIKSYPNAKICIYYVSKDVKTLLSTFLVEDYERDPEKKKVSVKLKDKLVDFQTQNVDEYYEFYQKSLYDIWIENYYSYVSIAEPVQSLMERTNVEVSYVQKGSKWSNIDKICQASMTRCFCDIDGNPIIVDETPKSNNAIIIRPRNILSIGNQISNKKTKLNQPSISAYLYERMIDFPITADLPFNWYNIIGTDYQNSFTRSIIANWANYNVNCSTGKINKQSFERGAYVLGDLTKNKNHIFKINDAKVNINKSEFDGLLSSLTNTTEFNNVPLVDEFPGISGVTQSFAFDDGEYITVYFRASEVIYSYDEEKTDHVGEYCKDSGYIRVFGDYFNENGEQIFGDESENATKLNSNELIQVDSKFDGNPLAQHIIDTVSQKYSNGVECVVMEVTPSEYQGEEGLAIDPIGQKPLFEKYDIVVPYVIRNGREQPYSTTSDGSPKSFKVVGIEYSYSGLLRQKLHLQENKD